MGNIYVGHRDTLAKMGITRRFVCEDIPKGAGFADRLDLKECTMRIELNHRGTLCS